MEKNNLFSLKRRLISATSLAIILTLLNSPRLNIKGRIIFFVLWWIVWFFLFPVIFRIVYKFIKR